MAVLPGQSTGQRDGLGQVMGSQEVCFTQSSQNAPLSRKSSLSPLEPRTCIGAKAVESVRPIMHPQVKLSETSKETTYECEGIAVLRILRVLRMLGTHKLSGL